MTKEKARNLISKYLKTVDIDGEVFISLEGVLSIIDDIDDSSFMPCPRHMDKRDPWWIPGESTCR